VGRNAELEKRIIWMGSGHLGNVLLNVWNTAPLSQEHWRSCYR